MVFGVGGEIIRNDPHVVIYCDGILIGDQISIFRCIVMFVMSWPDAIYLIYETVLNGETAEVKKVNLISLLLLSIIL